VNAQSFPPPVDGLSLRQVSRRFGARAAVNGVSLDVKRGEVLCLLGPSGCGKSTTLRIAAGLERPEAGQVFVGGRLVEGNGSHVPPEKRGVGLMFQDYALFPHLDAKANVAFGLKGVPAAERASRARDELARVGLAHLADAYPHTMSGGEQQRVALARMLAPKPDVVLMDEPFSGLDARLRDDVRGRTLSRLREAGAAVVIVTHDPDEAMRVGDRIALMRDGLVVQDGSPLDLYRAPADPQAVALFGGANVFHARIEGGHGATPFGATGTGGVADGEWAEIIFRPSLVKVAGEGALARVVSVRPSGNGLEVEAMLESGTLPQGVEGPAIIRAMAPNGAVWDQAVRPGAEIRLSASPEDAFVFPCLDRGCRA